MANHTSSTELIEKEDAAPTPPLKNHCKTTSCHKILTLMSTCALIMAGYTYYAVYQIQQKTAQSNQLLASSLQQFTQQQDRFQHQNSHSINQLEVANAALKDQIQRLKQQQEQLQGKIPVLSQDWLLLKAKHYIELAQINAHWNTRFNDTSTTMLLEQADQILASIHSEQLFQIRDILAQEILASKAAQQQDLSGLLHQLAAIQQQVDALTLATPLTKQSTPVASAKPLMPAWKFHFDNSLDVLKQLIIIRHVEQDTAPLLSPMLESLFKESMRISLQEAQWALIHANPEVYLQALTQAINTLKKYGPTYQNTAFLLQQLTDLSHVNVRPEPLSVGKALPLLHALIANRQAENAKNPLQKTGE
ncbi:MAG: hypothetical protein CK426_07540 [Legionella sp.]|nr:MAG: hypothetical protein CK423_04015 [Legionella sp.]PJD97731.1 MAG: hypothetical protein CK426_07540 [Legionella sp.]